MLLNSPDFLGGNVRSLMNTIPKVNHKIENPNNFMLNFKKTRFEAEINLSLNIKNNF
jgi:hypothetical protein